MLSLRLVFLLCILIIFEPNMLCQSSLHKLDDMCIVGNFVNITQVTQLRRLVVMNSQQHSHGSMPKACWLNCWIYSGAVQLYYDVVLVLVLWAISILIPKCYANITTFLPAVCKVSLFHHIFISICCFFKIFFVLVLWGFYTIFLIIFTSPSLFKIHSPFPTCPALCPFFYFSFC